MPISDVRMLCACATASESLCLDLDDVILDAILRFDVSDVVLLLLDAILEHFDVCDALLLVLCLLLLGD